MQGGFLAFPFSEFIPYSLSALNRFTLFLNTPSIFIMTLGYLYKQNRYFFLSYIVLLFFGIFILLAYSKGEGFILMNPWHQQPLDYFFRMVTLMGDGLFAVGLVLLLFLFKKKYVALMAFSSFAISGIVAQVIKYLFDSPRPVIFFENTGYMHFIEGVTLHNYNSFPSGHTTSAFAIAAALGFAVKNKNYSILFLLLAALTGYSRMYLGQHFMEDVLAGSVIGVVSAMMCWLYLDKFFKRKLKIIEQ